METTRNQQGWRPPPIVSRAGTSGLTQDRAGRAWAQESLVFFQVGPEKSCLESLLHLPGFLKAEADGTAGHRAVTQEGDSWPTLPSAVTSDAPANPFAGRRRTALRSEEGCQAWMRKALRTVKRAQAVVSERRCAGSNVRRVQSRAHSGVQGPA